MSTQFEVALLVGSTRTGSINERLARAIERVAPNNIAFKRVPMDELPFYNGDLETNRPEPVKTFVNSIRHADAVCIVSPEYNRSIPAVLKNAIDWGSKPAESSVWRHKVIATCGTSPGAIGTAIGQTHLRQILASIGAHVLPGIMYLSFRSPDMIDSDGNVADEKTDKFIKEFIARFAQFVELMCTQEPR